MTGYQSKKKAASAKTIDQVNWADHEPDGHVVRQTRKQRPWVGLTPEETSGFTQHEMSVAKYVSKVLQDKNT